MRNFYIYIILWFSGIFISMTIFFLWKSNNEKSQVKIFTKDFLNASEEGSTTLISDIFLSVNQLEIIRGKGVIDAKYRFTKETSLAYQIKNNPDQIYATIATQLKQGAFKTNNYQTQSSANNKTDFSIKPLPK